jgi:hypothetical protein
MQWFWGDFTSRRWTWSQPIWWRLIEHLARRVGHHDFFWTFKLASHRVSTVPPATLLVSSIFRRRLIIKLCTVSLYQKNSVGVHGWMIERVTGWLSDPSMILERVTGRQRGVSCLFGRILQTTRWCHQNHYGSPHSYTYTAKNLSRGINDHKRFNHWPVTNDMYDDVESDRFLASHQRLA